MFQLSCKDPSFSNYMDCTHMYLPLIHSLIHLRNKTNPVTTFSFLPASCLLFTQFSWSPPYLPNPPLLFLVSYFHCLPPPSDPFNTLLFVPPTKGAFKDTTFFLHTLSLPSSYWLGYRSSLSTL